MTATSFIQAGVELAMTAINLTIDIRRHG